MISLSFIARAGYTLQNWYLLKQDILSAVEGSDITEMLSTDWGTRFKVRTEWNGLNGQCLRVITVWQQDEGSDTVRFVTLYPDKLKGINALEESK